MRVTRLDRFQIREYEPLFREYLMHLRLEVDDVPDLKDDAMRKIDEAFGIAETQTNRTIIPCSIEIALENLSGQILLPVTPCSSILEIRYTDSGGNAAVLPPENYALVADEWKTELHILKPVEMSGESRPEKAWVTLLAGYRITAKDDTPDEWIRSIELPGSIKSAVKLIAGNLFNSDSDQVVGRSVSQTGMSYTRLLAPYRIQPYNQSVFR